MASVLLGLQWLHVIGVSQLNSSFAFVLSIPSYVARAIDKAWYWMPTSIQMASVLLGLPRLHVIGVFQSGSSFTFVLSIMSYVAHMLPIVNVAWGCVPAYGMGGQLSAVTSTTKRTPNLLGPHVSCERIKGIDFVWNFVFVPHRG
jgi:hypothetical protein